MKAKSITEKVKTFEDACKVLGLDPKNLPIVEHLPEKDRRSIVAYYKLTIIVRALNEGQETDLSDYLQRKYWNWFYVKPDTPAGLTIVNTYVSTLLSGSSVGSRLCFRTRELAEYAGEQFRDLYFEYLFIDMPKNYGK
jgi:hypothetical protein